MESDEKRRLLELEARVRALESKVWWQESPQPPAPSFAPPAPVTWQQPAATPHPVRPLKEVPQATPRAQFDLEKVLGARWLARAGVLVLALGVVFFLKLAYDRDWVPITGRFLIALLGGLAIFAAGDLLRTRRIDPAFAQIIAGGGAVISYVTIYLAWVFPDYRSALHLTLEAEVSLLAVTSALLGAYATWRRLPYLAGIAVVLSAALVAPAGAFSTVGLLYVALLDTAMLAAAAWRAWPPLVLSATVAA
ncbi:MAG: DUF2339 domain-containing protein, partial [Halobacteriales archaeon]|nr:DUF2339 domain-containing protein [Halobacteriales archaeon]